MRVSGRARTQACLHFVRSTISRRAGLIRPLAQLNIPYTDPCAYYTQKGVKVIAMSDLEPILREFLTREELAAELRLNPRTLDRWHVLSLGPPRTYVGRKPFYRRTSAQKWLTALEHQRRAS